MMKTRMLRFPKEEGEVIEAEGTDEGALYDEPTGTQGDGQDEPPNEPTESEADEPKQPTVNLSPEALEALAKLREQQQQPAREERREYSPEELKKIFKTVEVNEDLLRGLGFEEPSPDQVKGFQNFVKQIVTQAVTTSNILNQRKLTEFEQQLTPMQEHYREVAMQKAAEEFYGAHADLKPYDKIVRSVASQVSPTDASGKARSKQDVMKEIAETSRALLKESGINFTKKPATHSAGSKPAQMAGPGRSVASGTPTNVQNNPDAAIWDD